MGRLLQEPDPRLARAGFRQIVCIGSENSLQRQFKERYDGYCEAIHAAGLTPALIEIEEGLRLRAKKSLDAMLIMASGTVGKGDLGKV